MKEIKFIFCIHDHQPVGNFGHVFEKAYEECYKPFIDILADYPLVKTGLHMSGPLLEWIGSNRPAFFKDLKKLTDRGQVEMLSGGFYEPMLSILPDGDVRGQLNMLSGFIMKEFNQTPKGFWLTERVWDLDLPRMIDGTGMSYTLADDAHFSYAGMNINELHGYYITDKAGKLLRIFPINQHLRYMIPFRSVEEVVEYLRQNAMNNVDGLTYGDDGEKFGVWPGTREWVLEKGWLRRFFQAMTDNAEWIKMTLPREFIASHDPSGRVYLPNASYEEMMEWSLPASEIPVYDELRKKLQNENCLDRYRPFVRGGIWQNFLAKYPESNRIYRRMLRLSEELGREQAARGAGKHQKKLDDARRELYRSQCNCAYWHGLFGGLYLNYLRNALTTHLIDCGNILDSIRGNEGVRCEIKDIDDDLSDEAVIENKSIRVSIRPKEGGAVEEISLKDKSFNLTNLLGRRPEGYHGRLKNLMQGNNQQGGPASIHDIVRVKEGGLENFLIYDRFSRLSFIDHVIQNDSDITRFRAEQCEDFGSLSTGPWNPSKTSKENETGIVLEHTGFIREGGERLLISAMKKYSMSPDNRGFLATMSLTNNSAKPIGQLLAVELNLSLLASDDPKRRLVVSGAVEKVEPFNKIISFDETGSFQLRDEWLGIRVKVSIEPSCRLWHFPVETVSQSEDGFERTYQGSAFILVFPFSITPGDSFCYNVSIQEENLDI